MMMDGAVTRNGYLRDQKIFDPAAEVFFNKKRNFPHQWYLASYPFKALVHAGFRIT